MLELNLPKYEYLLKKEGGKLYIYDNIRKKYLYLTPEEWVRQHYINFLINFKNAPKGLMQIEGGLNYKELKKRSDILVYSKIGEPLLLVECKASSKKINNDALFQLGLYNSEINAPFLASTNGIVHYYWQRVEKDSYKQLNSIPDFNELSRISVERTVK